jgi:hypothetical protein
LLNLLRQDKGFETDHVGIAEVKLPVKLYSAAPDRIAFIDAVLQNLRSIPGAQSAGMVSAMPLEGESWIEPWAGWTGRDQDGIQVNARWVSPGYFEGMRQRLVAGRFLKSAIAIWTAWCYRTGGEGAMRNETRSAARS